MSAKPRSGEQSRGAAGAEGAGPTENVAEALARARRHARAAAAEALAAVRALLDAGSLAIGGEAVGAEGPLAALAQLLEDLSSRLASGAEPDPIPLLEAIAEALDEEVARWEVRATEDSEARAVLRAFLGLRELLWEFGVRRRPSAEAAPPDPEAGRSATRSRRSSAKRRSGKRVQRIPVDG